jgi:hypothetical protein
MCNKSIICGVLLTSGAITFYEGNNMGICPRFALVFNFRYLRSGLKDYMSKYKERWCIKICIKSYFDQISIKRLLRDIFHIGPGISPRLPYQARQRSWRADMDRGLIPGTIWKISCHNLFITYFVEVPLPSERSCIISCLRFSYWSLELFLAVW